MANAEGVPRKGETDAAKRAFETADPHAYQHLDAGALEFAGSKDFGGRVSETYEADGYTFHRIKEHQMPERQRLTALLLKGTVNVSDVIGGPDGALYSKDMHSGGGASPETTGPERYADLLVLSTLLGDRDHSLGRFPNNVAVRDGSHAIFDFDGRHRGRNPSPEFYVGAAPLGAPALEEFTRVPAHELTATVQAYRGKLAALKARYAGADGRALFHAVMAKARAAAPELTDDLYGRFMDQIERGLAADDATLARTVGAS